MDSEITNKPISQLTDKELEQLIREIGERHDQQMRDAYQKLRDDINAANESRYKELAVVYQEQSRRALPQESV